MKLEFLSGFQLEEDVTNKILAESQRELSEKDRELTNLTADRDDLRTRLGDVEKTLKSFDGVDVEGLRGEIKKLQGDLDAKEQDFARKMKERDYSDAVKESTAGMQFSSNSAKKAFVADLVEKQLPLQDGKLLGLEDFKKEYEKADPDAFAKQDSPPNFAHGTGDNPMLGKKSLSELTYQEEVKFKSAYPEQYRQMKGE